MFRVLMAAIFSVIALCTANIVQAKDVAIRAPICGPLELTVTPREEYPLLPFPSGIIFENSRRLREKLWHEWEKTQDEQEELLNKRTYCPGGISLSFIESKYHSDKLAATNPLILSTHDDYVGYVKTHDISSFMMNNTPLVTCGDMKTS
jgi:hypothetical protein